MAAPFTKDDLASLLKIIQDKKDQTCLTFSRSLEEEREKMEKMIMLKKAENFFSILLIERGMVFIAMDPDGDGGGQELPDPSDPIYDEIPELVEAPHPLMLEEQPEKSKLLILSDPLYDDMPELEEVPESELKALREAMKIYNQELTEREPFQGPRNHVKTDFAIRVVPRGIIPFKNIPPQKIFSAYLGGGYLIYITGPMGAGKSLELIRQIRRFRIAKKRILLVKHSFDIMARFSLQKEAIAQKEMTSRDGVSEPCILSSTLDEFCCPKYLDQYDAIAIDEAQFFPDLVSSVAYWLNKKKMVITAGCDADWRARPFGDYYKLTPWATEILKLKAVCSVCGEMDAAFSFRLSEGTKLVEIGDTNYEARCYRCFFGKPSLIDEEEEQR